MQALFKLITGLTGRGKFIKYIFLSVLSGLLRFLVVSFVAMVLGLIAAGKYKSVSPAYVFIFCLTLVFFIWTRFVVSETIVRLTQKLLWELRTQILNLIVKADYYHLADQRNRIYSTLVHDITTLTQASLNIVDFSASLIVAISCLIYMSVISLQLFVATIFITLAGILIYRRGYKKMSNLFSEGRNLENNFLKNFNSILNGHKEIHMNPDKGKEIIDRNISVVAEQSYSNNVSAMTRLLNNQITGQILFYLLIAVIVLYFSTVLDISNSNVVKFVFVLLYLLSSIETLMVFAPYLVRGRIAVSQLTALKASLSGTQLKKVLPTEYSSFDFLSFSNLRFTYTGKKDGFTIGPIDFKVRKGDVCFIYGGNGSGKTTFINCIIGLYAPTTDNISLNGHFIESTAGVDYRGLFAVVFSDFYLFDEVLTAGDIDQQKWDYYIRLFELEGKVALAGKRFSTTDLSTGQRKRLALIVFLMEQKPLLVLDEWAADQDPHFRDKFYRVILPLLKEEGFTIIAITHDDKYYHCADRIYRMENGQLMSDQHHKSSVVTF